MVYLTSKFLLEKLNLKKEFCENDIHCCTMKNWSALAFVPVQNLTEEFVQMKENASAVLDGKKISVCWKKESKNFLW